MPVSVVRVHDFIKAQRRAEDYAILVDRLWPRGVSKEKLRVDEWARDLAPSDNLRRWFGHRSERWDEFRRRYREELAEQGEALDRLRHIARESNLVLLYGARDPEHNQARVLAEVLSPAKDS